MREKSIYEMKLKGEDVWKRVFIIVNLSICHCSNKKSWKGGEFKATRRSANNAYNWSLEYSTKLRKNKNRISFLNWFVWVMWKLFSVGFRNLCLRWSLRNLNYTKSNKKENFIYYWQREQKQKNIYKYLKSYNFLLWVFIIILKSLHDSLIINAASYISFKILVH